MNPLRFALAGAVCLAIVAPAAGQPATKITRQDSKAQSNARNMVSEVESCFTDTEDYTKCDSEAELTSESMSMGIGLPYGSGPGQVRVIHAHTNSYTVDAHSRSGNHFYVVRTGDDRALRKCSKRGRGLCKRNGTW
jgi:type IV pilus assembly protein PilA